MGDAKQLVLALTLIGAGCGGDSASADDSGTSGSETGEEGESGSADESSTGGTAGPQIDPAPGGFRRVLTHHYVNSVRYLLGHDAAAAARPPDDRPLHGFNSIGAAELALSDADVDEYEVSATDIADAAIADLSTLGTHAPCVLDNSPGDGCYDEVATEFGHVAWRRPLSEAELGRLTSIGQEGRTWGEGDFNTGLKYLLMAILQSPHFLYVVEVGEADPDTGLLRLTGLELATRLSFFLHGSTPSRDLLTRAESGGLDTADQARNVAYELLADPQARAALSAFYDEYLHLNDLATLSKNLELFPMFDPQLAEAMRQEVQLLIADVVWERNTDFREFFTSDYTYVNGDLAELYNFFLDPDAPFEQYTIAAEQGRGGFLGTAAFLSRFSHPAENSPTRRGLFIQSNLLCAVVPPPPPNVEAVVPDFDPDVPRTLRERLEIHMTDEFCGSCHRLMDPIGFALEGYDPIGRYRTQDENGLPIDSVADVEGLGTFSNAKEIGQVLAEDPRGAECVVRSLFRNSMGHLETDGEDEAMDELFLSFESAEYRLQDVMAELVASPAFRFVGEPK